MSKSTIYSKIGSRILIGGGLAASAAVLGLPALAYAASYAYVNQNGQVMTVEADTAEAAIIAAPDISQNSGVLLLDSTSDSAVVGDSVSGA